MNSMKDKLTSSVRKAKARTTPQSESENVNSNAPSVADPTEENPKVKPASVKQKAVSADSVAESSGQLFPDRVWPD